MHCSFSHSSRHILVFLFAQTSCNEKVLKMQGYNRVPFYSKPQSAENYGSMHLPSALSLLLGLALIFDPLWARGNFWPRTHPSSTSPSPPSTSIPEALAQFVSSIAPPIISSPSSSTEAPHSTSPTSSAPYPKEDEIINNEIPLEPPLSAEDDPTGTQREVNRLTVVSHNLRLSEEECQQSLSECEATYEQISENTNKMLLPLQRKHEVVKTQLQDSNDMIAHISRANALLEHNAQLHDSVLEELQNQVDSINSRLVSEKKSSANLNQANDRLKTRIKTMDRALESNRDLLTVKAHNHTTCERLLTKCQKQIARIIPCAVCASCPVPVVCKTCAPTVICEVCAKPSVCARCPRPPPCPRCPPPALCATCAPPTVCAECPAPTLCPAPKVCPRIDARTCHWKFPCPQARPCAPPMRCPPPPMCPTPTPCTELPSGISLNKFRRSTTGSSPPRSYRSQPVKTTTTETAKAATAAHTSVPATHAPRSPTQYPIGDEWHSSLEKDGIHFRERTRMVGSVNYVHLVYDFDLQAMLDHADEVCNAEHEDLLRNKAGSKDTYNAAYAEYQSECSNIKGIAMDMVDTWYHGTETMVHHRYRREKPYYSSPSPLFPKSAEEDNVLLRVKRQFIIMGAVLLGLGIVAAAGYVFSHMTLASLSVNAYTNPATIHTLQDHETRLAVNTRSVGILKEQLIKLTTAADVIKSDVIQLQVLHRVLAELRKTSAVFRRMRYGLEQLHSRRLSSVLVAPKAMTKILRKFRENISLLQMKTLISNVEEVYDCPTSYLVFKNLTIRAITHIPAYKEHSLLRVYEFVNIPLSINGHFVSVMPSHDLIAVDASNQLFRPMALSDLSGCELVHHVSYCKNTNWYLRPHHNNCLHALFTQNMDDIATTCNFGVSKEKEILVQVTHASVVLFHPREKSATLTCLDRSPSVRSTAFKGFRKFNLEPGCRLETPEFVIDGTTNLFSDPNLVRISYPNFDSNSLFRALSENLNVSNDALALVGSQKGLVIKDINALFDKESLTYKLSIGFAGAFGCMIAVCLMCTCYCKCIRPCLSSMAGTYSSIRGAFLPSPSPPASPANARYDAEEGTVQLRPPRQSRRVPAVRPLANPSGRHNILYSP